MTRSATLARPHPALSREALDIAGWLRSRIAPQARLCADSRRVRPGDAFFAWRGHASDGRAYLSAARARGAAALVVDDESPAPAAAPDLRSVTGLRDLAGEIAASWHGEPAAQIDLIAVTGTNGKTSCSQWIAQGLARGGRRAAVIGTLGSGLLDAHGEAGLDSFGLTTPDALTLHALLAAFVAQGADSVVMEASSIGLDQSRLSGTQPAIAVFTNLSRDHLDYHGSLKAYAQAKLRLFRMPGLAAAVLNAGDALSVEARAALPVGCRVIAYGEAPLRLQLGRRLLKSGEVDAAMAELQRAALDPRCGRDAGVLLGDCFKQKGYLDLARKEYEKALGPVGVLDDRAKEILYTHGAIAEEAGDAAHARVHYARIFETDVGYKDVAAKMERLR